MGEADKTPAEAGYDEAMQAVRAVGPKTADKIDKWVKELRKTVSKLERELDKARG